MTKNMSKYGVFGKMINFLQLLKTTTDTGGKRIEEHRRSRELRNQMCGQTSCGSVSLTNGFGSDSGSGSGSYYIYVIF